MTDGLGGNQEPIDGSRTMVSGGGTSRTEATMATSQTWKMGAEPLTQGTEAMT